VLKIVRGLNPNRLLEAASSEFLAPIRATNSAPFPSPRSWLALRQGGLRDDLYALAYQRGIAGWFDPPLCLFAELPTILADLPGREVDDFERMVMIRSILDQRDAASGALAASKRDDYLDSIDRLFGELVAEGVSPDDLARILAAAKSSDAFESRRDDEIGSLFRAYMDTLAEKAVRDPRARLIDCAQVISADPDALATRLGGRRAIRLFGLADLRGGWRLLLRTLSESPALDDVTIYTSVSLPLGNLAHSEEALVEPESVAGRLYTEQPPVATIVPLVSAPDVQREVEEVARRVRELIDAGTAPHRIAIVSRQARPYVDLACDALARFGVPATARRRHSYREVPLVRALLALLDAAGEGWTRHGLGSLAQQPYIGTGLDATVLNYVGFRQRVRGLAEWETALRALERQALARAKRAELGEDTETDRRSVAPTHTRVVSAREALGRFTRAARKLDEPRTLEEWLGWLREFLARDPFDIEPRIYAIPDDRYQIARIDLRAWSALSAIVRDWCDSLDRWHVKGESMTVADFADRLREMLNADLAIWTATLRGVQVVEGLSAAYRSFDHVFLVGLEAGRFPTRKPSSAIWDEHDRERLRAAGLPIDSNDIWGERERDLFRVLVAGAKSLTVSYPRQGTRDADTLPSAFVEALRNACVLTEEFIPTSRVLTPTLALHRGQTIAAQSRRVALIERSRHLGAPSPHNGIISDTEMVAWLGVELGDDRMWSPTQIESYAKCRWAYLAGKLLKLELRTDPDEDMENTTRGTILHGALQRFYEAAVAKTGSPVYLRDAHRDLLQADLEKALDEATADVGQREWLGATALRSARRLELLRILRGALGTEIEYNEGSWDGRKKGAKALRMGVEKHELPFEDIVLERRGVRVRFRGFIDRVEGGVDERISGSEKYIAAVDYKTTRWSTPGSGDKGAWDDRVVLQVPLYAYALSQLYPERRVARVEYRALKSAETVHQLQPIGVKYKKGDAQGAIVEHEEAQQQLDSALDAVIDHVVAARAGAFPARPASTCGCPSFCAGIDICRVAGGPIDLFKR
jgi:PD-(D/E)XK nuclease superfamily